MSKQSKQEVFELVESYLNERYKFNYNCVSNMIEFKRLEVKKSKVEVLTDFIANSMRRELLHSDLSIGKDDFYSLLNSDFIPVYNPFENYFYKLPKWKYGDRDYIKEMALKVQTTKDELWQRFFKKWIVGVVACALDEKLINQTAIIFTGKQGIGKTTFLKGLIPEKLKNYYYEGTINPGSTDSLSQLAECLLINLDELESLGKRSAGGLKEIITKNSIRMRRPYGRINENFPRRASFCGSVNNIEFLRDTTGNRRFLCFEALSFNNGKAVNLDMVYSQALFLWRNGFEFWLSMGEIQEINDNNSAYQVLSQEEDSLCDFFEPCTEEDEYCQLLTTSEIHRHLRDFCKLPNTDASVQQLGKALHAKGFIKKKRNSQQVWLIKQTEELKGSKV